MAEKRMFSKAIIDSDSFLDMPLSTQALYFHLNMRADDDGFINNSKKICRMVGCNDDDLKMLAVKSFVIPFETGVVVIKHWRMHNILRKDRYRPTLYTEEAKALYVKKNKAYTLKSAEGTALLETEWQPNGNQLEPQSSIDKSRLDKNRLDKDRVVEGSITTDNQLTHPTKQEIIDYCYEIGSKINPARFFNYYSAKGWMVHNNPIVDWKAQVRLWEEKEKSAPNSSAWKDYADD